MSMVLFLTNCSLTKDMGGAPAYDAEASMAAVLGRTSAALGDRLLEGRRQVFDIVKTGNLEWQGAPVKDLPFNQDLVAGEDLGGRRTASYLPAIERYQGRFFQALGSHGRGQVAHGPHRVLFLSGLYGLVRPLEPIQLYSCPLHSRIAASWQEGAVLTEALCAYVDQFEIARIIDMTAIDDYRALIDWDRVASKRVDVLHCFDVMAPGDQALTAFGRCLADPLLGMSDDELAELEAETQIGTVRFRSLAALLPPASRPDAPPTRLPRDDRPLAQEARKGPWTPAITDQFFKDARRHMNQFGPVMKATVEVCHDPASPRGDTVKALKGGPNLWRYRIGDYRLIYSLERRGGGPGGTVRFERFGPRGDVYKHM